MFKKVIYASIVFASMLSAAVVNTDKNSYTSNESVIVDFSEMEARSSDWIGVYPVGTNNDWGNQVQWSWTNDVVEGRVVFDPLPLGTYEVRVFYNNTFIMETSKEIVIEANIDGAIVNTNKNTYFLEEEIVVSFDNMSANARDWIGIYPLGSTNEWNNMLQWQWVEDAQVAGQQTFGAMPAGDYEVRVFFNNSFNQEASHAFSVEAKAVTTVDTSKNTYLLEEEIVVSFDNMSANARDWIGIYPAGSTNEWNNMLQWQWVEDAKVAGQQTFVAMPVGDYEVRVFFNNSFNQEASHAFSVEEPIVPVQRILYDDFEDGIDPRWVRTSGQEMTLLNVGAIDGAVEDKERQVQVNGEHSLRTYLGGGYYFPFGNPDKKLKFLELDVKIGVSSHRFNFGVRVKTILGNRSIEFSSWLNHTLPNGQQIIRGPYGNVLEGHTEAYIKDGIHLHPGPSDFYVGTTNHGGGANMFVHYKIDIEEKLKLLEPDNELVEILAFTINGGDYDNLALSEN